MSFANVDGFRRLFPAALLLWFAGCASWRVDLPADFLRVDEPPDLVAISAEHARFRVREFAQSNQGSLDFWIDALKHDLLDQRGYSLVEEGAVEDGDGHPGRFLCCTTTHSGERCGYLVAIFVYQRGLFDPHQVVRTAEFAAREEVFSRHRPDIQRTIATVRR